MKLSRTQKIYLSVGALAVAALAVDRLFLLGGPQHAAADSLDGPPRTATHEQAEDPAAASAEAPDLLALVEQLEALRPTLNADLPGRDAFSIGPVLSQLQAEEPDPAVREQTPLAAGSWVLTAVVSGSEGKMAVINGRTVKIGQRIEGAQLEAVAEQQAVLRVAGRPLVLRIDPIASR